jgi:hypothetical protein
MNGGGGGGGGSGGFPNPYIDPSYGMASGNLSARLCQEWNHI